MEKASLEIAAKKFLKQGTIGDIDLEQLASACDREIQKASRHSLKSGLILAKKFFEKSCEQGKVLERTACKTLARLKHMCGAHAEALPLYLKARRLARSQPLVRAQIDRALVDVYIYLGEFARAKQSAQRALAGFGKVGTDADLIMTEINYANLLHRQDRHKEAERLYGKGAEFFKETGNQLAMARCNYNRANTLVQLFELKEAEYLYRQALQVYENAGHALDANDARYGLAWLNMLTGQFHTAILDLAECENIYREGGDPRGEALCILDLAEVYLGLGLYSDALLAARKSEKLFLKLKLRYESSKAALFYGQAAMALEKRRVAIKALNRAIAGFQAEKNSGFMGVTHLLAADLAETDWGQRRRSLRLARSRFAESQLPLWEAVCDLQEANDPKFADRALKRLSQNRAAREVPHIFALWHIALGDNDKRVGRVSSARKKWQMAADRLDAVRAQLPPVELRNVYGRRQSSPHLRLILAELGHDALKAAAWSERYKTAGVWSQLPLAGRSDGHRKAAEESLYALANQVANLAGRIDYQQGQRQLPATYRQKILSNLQRQVRDKLMAIEGNPETVIAPINRLARDIQKISAQLPVIQFHLNNNDIIAFVHNRGKTSIRHFPGCRSRLSDAIRRWRFIMEGELLADYMGGNRNNGSEYDLWSELGEWLWAPLNMSRDYSKVLIIPEGELANLPWQALIIDDKPLLQHHQFIVAPSLRHYLAARNTDVDSNGINIFRGVADNLPLIDKELEVLQQVAGERVTLYNPCRRNDWPSTGSSLVWHYAGHSSHRVDNPFYSHLHLEDGPLFAADFRIKLCRVGLVTLAACRSGEQVAVPGEESAGLVRSLLEMGARNVIASHWPVSDRTTALWMKTFYNIFFENCSILEAAREAAEVVKKDFPSAYHWAAFTVFGAGNLGGPYETWQ